MVAGVFAELAARPAPAPLHDRHQRRRLRHEPQLRRRRSTSSRPRRCARSSSASAPTARSARTRTRSRSSAPRKGCTRRATSSTTRRSRARRPSRTCASGRSRSARPISCSRRASSAATSSGCSSRPTCSAAAADGATLLLNCARPADEVWDALSRPVQEQILAKQIELYAIDAGRIAREVGLAGRTNIILQTCFFAISGVLPTRAGDRADQGGDRQDLRPARRRGRRSATRPPSTARSKACTGSRFRSRRRPARGAAADRPGRRARVRPHRHRGDDGRPRRRAAGQRAAGRRHVPERHRRLREAQHLGPRRRLGLRPLHPVRQLQLRLPAQRDPLPVLRPARSSTERPDGFPSAPLDAVGLPDTRYTLQVYVEDCTGCCAVRRGVPGRRAGRARRARRSTSRRASRWSRPSGSNIAFFETLPATDRSRVDFGTVRGTQFLEPLFEFSGACAGCGETPYVKLLSQLFGDRLMVANATGCSSIYGGNLPTTPWTTDADGRGPGLVELALRGQRRVRARLPARRRPAHRAGPPPPRRAARRSSAPTSSTRSWLRRSCASRSCAPSASGSAELKRRLDGLDGPAVADLRSVVDHLVRRSVWIVGGDGWAYDIGSGGLDHVLASGRNVNVLVLDTEVYSNTGGQMSKSTPLGAVAKFAAAGKTVPKKDLALQAIAYGNVYVARVAMGADPQQTLSALPRGGGLRRPVAGARLQPLHRARDRDARTGLDQQYRAVASGYWPLIRYDPVVRADGGNPFLLDSPRPRIPLADYTDRELRYRSLANTDPAEAERLHALAEQAVDAALGRLRGDGDPRRAADFAADARRDALMDLSTTYWGFRCATRSSRRLRRCPRTVDGVRRLADAGVGAVVLYSLFEEQLRREAERERAARRRRDARASPSRSPTSRPTAEDEAGPRRYLSLLERAAAAVDVPVIGSLNGVTPSGWVGLRPGDAGRRRGRDRAQHLLPARRPAHLRPRGRAAAHRRPASASRTRSACRSRSS